MSEDRLEQALQQMKQEAVDAPTLEAARVRVWDKVTNPAVAGCAEFRPDFRAYLSGALAGGRRVLLEDHISRCAACRTVADAQAIECGRCGRRLPRALLRGTG